MRLNLDTTAAFPNIQPVLVRTPLLKNDQNQNLVGDAYAFDTTNPRNTRSFDPEGVTMNAAGNFFVSDEYGPFIYEFTLNGRMVRRITVLQQVSARPADRAAERRS